MPAISTSLAGLVAAAVVGVAAGIGSFAFFFAEGDSYMTDDPTACANCHVMQGHLDGWQKSSHHAVAVCNDCHTPSGPVAKYVVKARNGWNHSRAFTTGDYPENIRAHEATLEVVEGQCRHCHANLVMQMTGGDESVSCLRCHTDVGHVH